MTCAGRSATRLSPARGPGSFAGAIVSLVGRWPEYKTAERQRAAKGAEVIRCRAQARAGIRRWCGRALPALCIAKRCQGSQPSADVRANVGLWKREHVSSWETREPRTIARTMDGMRPVDEHLDEAQGSRCGRGHEGG